MSVPRVPVPDVAPGGPFARRPLPPGEIHVWVADLDRARTRALPGHSPLSAEETARASGFAGERRRARWVASRTLLRRILAAYLDRDPASIGLVTVGEGKPALADAPRPLRFNLSHCGAVWMLAAAADAAVGIDVERTDRAVDASAVAWRVFAPAEAEALAALGEDARRRAFFRVWTAREAATKALGRGLFTLGNSVEIEADPARPLGIRAGGGPLRGLVEVPAPAGHVAALAFLGEARAFRCWRADG